jgi:hypothetical protein
MARVGVLPAIVTMAVFAGACTTTPPNAPPTFRAAPLTGTILAVGGESKSIVRYVLPSEAATTIVSPLGDEAANRGTFDGISGGVGSATFVAVNGRSARTWVVPPGGTGTSSVAEPLHLGTSRETVLAIGDGRAAVATCAGVWTTPLQPRARWVRLGKGCWVAVGPGGEVAFSRDGDAVVSIAPGRGVPRQLFRLHDLRGVLGTTSASPVLVGNTAWTAHDGMAFSVRAGDQLAVFVRTPDGEIVPALQEQYSNTFRVPRLAWRPGGGLLAIADDVGPGGSVLRVFDPSTGTLRAAALDPLGFSGMEWAPDGSAIAILTGSSALLVVDPNGEWISRVKTDWKGLLAWTS